MAAWRYLANRSLTRVQEGGLSLCGHVIHVHSLQEEIIDERVSIVDRGQRVKRLCGSRA